MFKSAVRYGVFSKESDKLWGFPIDTEKINIHSSDLAETLKENDAAFSESDISCLRIYNNKARNKILWECYYDDEDHKIAETDANTGEIVRTMDSWRQVERKYCNNVLLKYAVFESQEDMIDFLDDVIMYIEDNDIDL